MFKVNKAHSGVTLYLVILMLIIVLTLSVIVVNLIVAHTRLTSHQIERVKAYYTAMAGINLAYTRLRTGYWGNNTYHLNKSGATVGTPCTTCIDVNLPYNVTILIEDATIPPMAAGYAGKSITASVDYLYTAPDAP
jgi:Tfp pilus assembly protein PilX